MAAILGAILAGGLSLRMGQEKAFVLLHGRPLIGHVLARLAPQVERVVVNANRDPARFAPFGCPVVPDRDASRSGPLAGLSACLAYGRAQGYDLVATVPSDAPFLPADLVARLQTALTSQTVAAVVSSTRGLEPLFALWRVDARPIVDEALQNGERAVYRVLEQLVHARVDFAAPRAFLNLNTPDELAAARAMDDAARR